METLREQAALTRRLEKIEEALRKAGLLDPAEPEKPKEVSVSPILRAKVPERA